MTDNKDELSMSSMKIKDGKPSSIKCPMLNNSNYTVWAIRMKICLQVNEVWEAIEPGIKEDKKNIMAIALLFQSIPEALILQLGSLDTAKAVWEAIKTRNIGADRVKDARLQTLMADFDKLTMKEGDTIDSLVGRLAEITSTAASLGETIEEPKVVKKFLSTLPVEDYIHIVASLEQVLDLNKTSFEDIVGRIKAFEARISVVANKHREDTNKLMWSNTENPQNYQDDYKNNRGRGQGGRTFWRPRGRGRFGGQGRGDRYNQQRDDSRVICYHCDKLGHYALNCPDRLLKLQEVSEKKGDETQEADTLMMHEVVYLNEKKVQPSVFESDLDTKNLWYLDNGASNHMSGNRSFFHSLDETITGKVRFGDNSRIDIQGKGSIQFVLQNGEKKILHNVYYIPKLKSNIISLGQATEVGCEVRMKEEY